VLLVSGSHQQWRKSNIGKQIGERVRELRNQQAMRLTQQELAGSIHISVSYLSLIERGLRVPTMYTLAAIAQALDVPLTELLAAVEQRPDQSPEVEVVRRISDFIQRHRLGTHDVRRLLRVARLMFDADDP
jgi:transcriptional regulator with XRE-family HTH domain